MNRYILMALLININLFANETDDLVLAGNHVRPWLQAPVIESYLPLDIAVRGLGFFVVEDQENNDRFFSLDGKITMSRNGFLVQKETGLAILGYKDDALQPIKISDYSRYDNSLLRSIKIDLNGEIAIIYQNGVEIKRHKIALALFQYPRNLQRIAKHVFKATTDSGLPHIGLANHFRRGKIYASQLAVLVEPYYQQNMDNYVEFTAEKFPLNYQKYF